MPRTNQPEPTPDGAELVPAGPGGAWLIDPDDNATEYPGGLALASIGGEYIGPDPDTATIAALWSTISTDGPERLRIVVELTAADCRTLARALVTWAERAADGAYVDADGEPIPADDPRHPDFDALPPGATVEPWTDADTAELAAAMRDAEHARRDRWAEAIHGGRILTHDRERARTEDGSLAVDLLSARRVVFLARDAARLGLDGRS